MKPRNKFEKAVLAQSKKLRPITPIQINWAFRNCVEHYAHRLPKGRTTCMDCGHSWVMTEQTEHCTCPECGASLKVCLTYQRKVRQKQYFTTLTTSGEYQVLRMFLLVVGMEKGVNAKSYALEIGQYWWNEQGRKAVVAIPRTLGCYMTRSHSLLLLLSAMTMKRTAISHIPRYIQDIRCCRRSAETALTAISTTLYPPN